LAPDGRFHTLGGTAWPILEALTVGPLISLFSDRWSGLMLWWKPFNPDDVAYLGGLVAAGKLVPAIDSRYPLDEIVPALRRVHEGLARGKVLITF
jgi:NADPH:quinone reductase-like Zn-dependent oxidoreductase